MGFDEKAKTSAYIRTLSYHDFLEDNLHPTKEQIAKAKKDLCDFNTLEWVLLSDAKAHEQEEIDKLQNILVKYNKEVLKYEQKTEELKQNLQRWFEKLGTWIFSQRKDWSHPELPEKLKEEFMELLNKG